MTILIAAVTITAVIAACMVYGLFWIAKRQGGFSVAPEHHYQVGYGDHTDAYEPPA